MGRRRRLAAALAVVAALTLVAGSGAFTSAELGRGIHVAVAGDDSAFLGVASATEGCELSVTVTNRFSGVDLDATVSVDVSGDVRAVDPRKERSVRSGDSVTFTFELTPTEDASRGDGTERATFEVHAEGDGVTVDLARTQRGIDCQPDPLEPVTVVGVCSADGVDGVATVDFPTGQKPTSFTWAGDGVDAVVYKTTDRVYAITGIGDVSSDRVTAGDGTVIQEPGPAFGGATADPCGALSGNYTELARATAKGEGEKQGQNQGSGNGNENGQ